MAIQMDKSLFDKYNIPAPRYTSYPTVPSWENTPNEQQWKERIKNQYAKYGHEGISMYVHLPFCESICTYCGCNKVITKNHSFEDNYIDALLQEWRMYKKLFGTAPLIKEIHLGGGTPTFFSPDNLRRLIEYIKVGTKVAEDAVLSVEVHPSYTTEAHLKTLNQLGFNRISVGIQDFDPIVQNAISRIQTFEEVEEKMKLIRHYGFDSVNFDLIFGLPFQTLNSIEDTLQKVAILNPDRIAFYGYAHVPWTSRAQRKFSDDDIPQGEEKRRLYELGQSILHEQGYSEIGMDHFAKKEDELYKAFENGELHRNFMGYTTAKSKFLIGLGASSISDSGNAYVQNEKNFLRYQKAIAEGHFPIIRGHLLSEEDLIVKHHILNLMCQFKTRFVQSPLEKMVLEGVSERLSAMEDDGLVACLNNGILLSGNGRPFVRNVCMALDPYIHKRKNNSQKPRFSKAV